MGERAVAERDAHGPRDSLDGGLALDDGRGLEELPNLLPGECRRRDLARRRGGRRRRSRLSAACRVGPQREQEPQTREREPGRSPAARDVDDLWWHLRWRWKTSRSI